MPVTAFREYLRVVRALLRGEEVDFTHDGVTRAIRFLHLDLGFIALDPPVPIYVAANAPRMLAMVGELADGHVAMGNERPRVLGRHLDAIRGGAAKAGRTLPDGFHTTALITAVVLRPREAVDSERVVEQCGSQVAAGLHFAYEAWSTTRDDAVVPRAYANVWQEYVDHVAAMKTPADRRYLEVHEGHCTYLVPAERRFVTAETIRAAALVGEPDELIAQIRAAEAAGLRELGLLPPMAAARTILREFTEHVIARY
jgi:5,10-methylenetetrahydromethanopterin reductase